MEEKREVELENLENLNSELNKVISIIQEKRAQKIILYDLKALTALFDYSLIATGLSSTQIDVIRRSIEKEMKTTGILPLGIEGTSDSGWILMDYNDFIIHLFTPVKRKYYRLDNLLQDQPLLEIESDTDISE